MMKKMKYFYSFTIIIFLLVIILPTEKLYSQKESTVTFKVLTYNIYSARKIGIQAIADVINKINPDFVSLQEVERNTKTNPMDFPKEIAKLTNMPYYYFIHAIDIKTGGDYGNVILSKYPISEEKTYQLDIAPGDKDDKRSFGFVRTEKEGKSFYFAATHLGYRQDDASRLLQINEILSIVKNLNLPIILAGDLNSRRGSATIPALQNFFTVDCLSDTAPWTAPAPNPTYPCDWILYSPSNAFKVLEYNAAYWANKESDHFPVFSVIQIK